MSFHYLIDSATGEKLGETADKVNNAPTKEPKMVGREWIDFDTRPEGEWDAVNRVVIPFPAPRKYATKRKFLEALTDAEQEAILGLSKTNTKAELFLEKLRIQGDVEIGAYLQAALNQLESLGTFSSGRADEIYNGLNA